VVEQGSEEAQKRKELRRAEYKLRRAEAILKAVSFSAERFLGGSGSWEETIQQVLKRLGEAAEASRVCVFENYTGEDGKLWNRQRCKWQVPGVPTGFPAESGETWVTDFPYRDDGSGRWEDFGRWEEILGQGEPVYGNTRDFPENERPALVEVLGIRSMIVVPIFVNEEWWGFIGFDDCFKEREWSVDEIDALKAAASTLGAAVRRWQIEGELVQSEARYGAVIEQATDGIYLLDAASRRLLETNPSLQRMLGYTADELQGMEVYDFIAHPRENVDAVIQRTLEQRRRVVGGRKYRRKDGWLVDVEVGVNVISYAGKEVICTIVRDVSERIRNEEKLRQSERLYRTVIEQVSENICLADAQTKRIVASNPAFEAALGYTSEELEQMTLYDIVANDRTSVERNVRRVVEEGRLFVGDRKYRRKDGSLLDVEVSASMIVRDDRETLCIVAHDITERARAQELLERSRERLVSAREEERKRLRRDLHDGVGPQLAALTLKLETARNLLSGDPRASSLLAELTEHARNTVSDVRRSVHALRPPSLDELGLIGALSEGAAQYSHNELCLTVKAPEHMPPLPAAVEVAAYRIAQEAMTNVVRHAGASNCSVRIWLDEEASVLRLEIEDDGRGIGDNHKGGVGMHSMRERAEELGGRCTIESRAGSGTRVSAQLPFLMTDDAYRKEE